MKHKHHDKIVAKAANTGLVQLIKMDGEWEDAGLSYKFISFSEEYDYFLCLPQRKNACLHWLNGWEVQGEDPNRPNYFYDYANFVDRKKWSCTSWYMRKDINVRIKPKKEKRWILECSGTLLTTRLFTAESSAQQFLGQSGHSTDCVQFIEIEVEV